LAAAIKIHDVNVFQRQLSTTLPPAEAQLIIGGDPISDRRIL